MATFSEQLVEKRNHLFDLGRLVDLGRLGLINNITPKRYIAMCRLKEKAATIDYHCGFKNGICYSHRARNSFNKSSCCCQYCARELGYLDKEGISAEVTNTYNEAWTDETGFLGSKGCCLPHHLRSFVCLIYNCSPMISEDDRKIIHQLQNMRILYTRLFKRNSKAA